jgi:molecular chaperone GrpE (heat shock protein)
MFLTLFAVVFVSSSVLSAKLPNKEWTDARAKIEALLSSLKTARAAEAEAAGQISSVQSLPPSMRAEKSRQLAEYRANLEKAQKDIETVEKELASAIEAIARDNSPRAFKYLLELAESAESDTVFRAIANGIGSFTDQSVTAEIEKTLLDANPASNKGKIILIETVVHMEGDAKIEMLIKCLEAHLKIPIEKHEQFQSVLFTLIDALGRVCPPDDSSRRVVEALLKIVQQYEKKKGRVWMDAREVVKRVTGEDFSTFEEYDKWWKNLREKWTGKKTAPDAPKGSAGKYTTRLEEFPTLFGTEVSSKLVVFVLDVSHSMLERDPGKVDEGEDDDGKKNMGTSVDEGPKTGVSEKERKKLEEQEKAKQGKPEIDPRRTRIYRAKKELKKLIKQLPEDVRFNIVAFSKTVRIWSNSGLKDANPANRDSARKFVDSFEAETTTWTDDAIEAAFKNLEADTIYLLSDGSPTHNGDPAVDSDELIKEIFDFVRKENRIRKIKINTLGFVGANRPFMQKLAHENGGEYKDIE